MYYLKKDLLPIVYWEGLLRLVLWFRGQLVLLWAG